MFKKLALIFFIISVFFLQALRGSELEIAERFFLQGDYRQAVVILKKIADRHPHFIVDYNLGLCFWKLNDFYQSRKYLLRALLKDRSDPQLLSLLKKVDQQLGLNENQEEFFTESVFVQKVRLILSGSILKLTLWITFYILNLLLFLSLLHRKFYLKTFVLTSITFLLLFIIALSGYRQERIIKRGIVAKDTFLWAQPEEGGVRLDQVKKAMALRVVQLRGKWLQVLVENRYAGWIAAEQVELF